MDARQMESLVRRLVQNPHDQDAITSAHQAGQSDPKAYATLLEQVGKATQDAMFASHWLTEAANVWSTSLGDMHRAARVLMTAIDRDPTQPTPAERLADLYREKGDTKALVALLDRRGKALSAIAQKDPAVAEQAGNVYEELGRMWAEPPLSQSRKAVEHYQRAVAFDPRNQYAIYGLRELFKAQEMWVEAVPLFAAELALVEDPERRLALFQDEAEVRKSAGDRAGASQALRNARATGGQDNPTLKQLLATSVLERVQAGDTVPVQERQEGAQLFVELAEEYPGEHGYSYSSCALDLDDAHDRAIQLAMYYGEQLGRQAEVAPRAAQYLKKNPQGPLAGDARDLVNRMMELGGDVSMAEALAPPPDADAGEQVSALLDQAKALARKAKKREAAAKYQEIIAFDPGNEEAIGFLEGYLRQTRRYGDLKELLLSASASPDIDGEQAAKWIREVAGLCETQLRDVDGALEAWQRLLELEPDSEEPLDQLKRLYERGKRWDELTQLLQARAERTDDIEARLSLEKSVAKIHEQRRKDPVASGEAWARIAALAPGDDGAIDTAVDFFEKGERADLAVEVITANLEGITDTDARASLCQKLGELHEAGGQSQKAGEAFAEAAAATRSAELWSAAERCFVGAEAWEQAANAVDERAELVEAPEEQAGLFALGAEYLIRAQVTTEATVRLEQATDLDPANHEFAERLEALYREGERFEDLASFLLRRADKLDDVALRTSLRKAAAKLQRDKLEDPEAARDSLALVLEDTDDAEALLLLADDAEEKGDFSGAAELLARLGKAADKPEDRIEVLLREARIVAEGMQDRAGAIERYESLLKDIDKTNAKALAAIAELQEQEGNHQGTAEALERLLENAEEGQQLSVARRLADLYEGPLDDVNQALRCLRKVRELDDEDYDALERLCTLSEKHEDWEGVAKYMALLIEVEGDEEEVSQMTRRLAEILNEKVGKGDEALAALMGVGDLGDEPCREEYVALGDRLGWKGIVAAKLVEWYLEAAAGAERNKALRGAFERFIEVGRDADAAGVAKELVRSKGADIELAERLEEIAVRLKDLDALEIAHDLKIAELSGPPRAEEMVRQAEVMAQADVDAEEAIQHGEQALTSVSPEDVEGLLERLAALAKAPGHIIDIYERQVTRCKSPTDRLRALARAAHVATSHDSLERARQFFDIALGGGVQEETLAVLEDVAREADADGEKKLTRTLAQALAAGGQGSRDGGRTRSALLGRAAQIAYAELSETDQAFAWLGDALVTHVDDARLDELEQLADEVGDPKRAEAVLVRALEEVFDGPLVRKLLARRASLRQQKLNNATGAAQDLKRLHDLSPSDTAVMDQLAELYTELGDYRGMVQLYEDQILRGKDPASRADLARKVAIIWEQELDDPREAADAWRRVLRMRSGDSEAQEGLERAKQAMLKRPKEMPAGETAPSAPEAASEPAAASDQAEDESEVDRVSEPPSASQITGSPGDGSEDTDPDANADTATPASEPNDSAPTDVDAGVPADTAATAGPPSDALGEEKSSADDDAGAAQEEALPEQLNAAEGSDDSPADDSPADDSLADDSPADEEASDSERAAGGADEPTDEAAEASAEEAEEERERSSSVPPPLPSAAQRQPLPLPAEASSPSDVPPPLPSQASQAGSIPHAVPVAAEAPTDDDDEMEVDVDDEVEPVDPAEAAALRSSPPPLPSGGPSVPPPPPSRRSVPPPPPPRSASSQPRVSRPPPPPKGKGKGRRKPPPPPGGKRKKAPTNAAGPDEDIVVDDELAE